MVTKHEDIMSTVNFKTGVHVYNVPFEMVEGFTTTFHVDQVTLQRIAQNDGTSYWAADGDIKGSAIEWKVQESHEYGENGREVLKYRATYERFAVALVEVATGKHNFWESIEHHALMVLMGQTDPSEDCEANDCIIQVALFGKVIYG